jgi:hypothetical protein
MEKKAITAQIISHPLRTVVQTIEPEAARLLMERGGNVACYEWQGMYYWEDRYYADQHLLSWPPETLSVYVSAQGQEDSTVTFAAFRLPASKQELHLVYDYRVDSPYYGFEEHFTLRVAEEQLIES